MRRINSNDEIRYKSENEKLEKHPEERIHFVSWNFEFRISFEFLHSSFEFLSTLRPPSSDSALCTLKMPSLRLQRVRELLKRQIGEVIRREFEVSEAGLITVNDVDVSGDLHSAVVFISIFGKPEQQKRGIALLTRHRKRIQGLVGRAVVLKYTPTLKFILDDSVVRGNRVLKIIDELEKAEAEPGTAD
jgi:ribosome-binding factor A